MHRADIRNFIVAYVHVLTVTKIGLHYLVYGDYALKQFQFHLSLLLHLPSVVHVTNYSCSFLTANGIEDLIWGEFDRRAAVVVRNPQSQAMSVLRQYVEEPNVGRHDDPLAWWRCRQLIYKELAPLALKYLCIVATSVPSERIFSKAGELVSARRSRLAPKTVQMVLFLNQNHKFL